jgi:hypothetical protein
VAIYLIDVQRFGTVALSADTKGEAREMAKRFHGYSNLRRFRAYKHCEKCDSRPCCCKQDR